MSLWWSQRELGNLYLLTTRAPLIVQTPRALGRGLSRGPEFWYSGCPAPIPRVRKGISLGGPSPSGWLEGLFKQLSYSPSVYLGHSHKNLFYSFPVSLYMSVPAPPCVHYHHPPPQAARTGPSLGLKYPTWPLSPPLQLENEPAAEDGACGHRQGAQ